MSEQMKIAVTAHLVGQGWTREEGTALASKNYRTAVGVKQAHVYLADYGPNSTSFLLTGDYQSEGRNQLEPHAVMIRKQAGAAEIAHNVEIFARQADVVVSQSFAARLLAKEMELEIA